MDQNCTDSGPKLHRVATKEREEVKRTTKQKMTRRHNKEGGHHLKQESNRQRTTEDIDRGLHPAVDGQSLGLGGLGPKSVGRSRVREGRVRFTAASHQ